MSRLGYDIYRHESLAGYQVSEIFIVLDTGAKMRRQAFTYAKLCLFTDSSKKCKSINNHKIGLISK